MLFSPSMCLDDIKLGLVAAFWKKSTRSVNHKLSLCYVHVYLQFWSFPGLVSGGNCIKHLDNTTYD